MDLTSLNRPPCTTMTFLPIIEHNGSLNTIEALKSAIKMVNTRIAREVQEGQE